MQIAPSQGFTRENLVQASGDGGFQTVVEVLSEEEIPPLFLVTKTVLH